MKTAQETAADKKRKDNALRERIQFLFSSNPTVRLDAQEALKECWLYDAPSFDFDELATMPHDNCVTAAARRDGSKEVIAWLCNLKTNH